MLPIVFDINLDYTSAMNRMQYLVDGHYIDNGTESVDVQFITYNGELSPGQIQACMACLTSSVNALTAEESPWLGFVCVRW